MAAKLRIEERELVETPTSAWRTILGPVLATRSVTSAGCARDSATNLRVSRAVTASPRRPRLLRGCADTEGLAPAPDSLPATVGAGEERPAQDTIGSTE